MKEKQAPANVAGPRCRKAGKTAKSRILDEFRQNAGCHRKYAAALLKNAGKARPRRIGNQTAKAKTAARTRRKRRYKRLYDEPAGRAVPALRRFFRSACGKRPAPMIRGNPDALAEGKRFRRAVAAGVQTKPAKISRPAAERTSGRERRRSKGKGKGSAKPGAPLKHQIPARAFWRRDGKPPGFCGIDAVPRGGGYAAGGYAFTLALTDARLCRPEFRALKNKARLRAGRAPGGIRRGFPAPLKGTDSGGGAEFINRRFKHCCEPHAANFTRGRRRRKNDNAYIEQKNGGAVRKTVGCGRFQGGGAPTAPRPPAQP